MSILEGAYWISSQKYRKYLKADADGTVHGVDSGPRGTEILDSASLRARIWLIEKATDGRSFRLRNYETGFALDIKDRKVNDEAPVAVTRGSTDSQLWSIDLDNATNGLAYRIQSGATSAVLDQIKTTDDHLVTISAPWKSRSDQLWLFEPVLLPALYQLTNQAMEYIMAAPDYANVSDGISGEVMLASRTSTLPTRSRLWTFEYTSIDESLVRSALPHQFALDLAPDMKTAIVQRQHMGASQRWIIKDKDAKQLTINLTNAKTGTLLTGREHEILGGYKIYAVSTSLNGHIDWQIQTSPQPPMFWITIQNSAGAFLAQANNRSIILSRGALHPNDHAVHWRLIMIGNDLRYVIVNRATGFVLGCDYSDSIASTYGGTIYPRANDEDRNHVNNQWVFNISGDGCIAMVHVGSKYTLHTHKNGSYYSCRCTRYTHGSYDDPSSWIFLPVYDSLPSFAFVNPHTGRCLACNPDPETGTVSALDEVNDFRSQWLLYDTSNNYNNFNPNYVLLSKVSGTALERFMTTRVEAHDYYDNKNTHQSWKIIPRYGGMITVADSGTPTRYFLNELVRDNGEVDPSLGSDCFLSWYLVSHRELGFDSTSLDFDVLKRLLPYIPNGRTAALSSLTQRYTSASANLRKGNEKYKHITRTSRNTRVTNETLRVVLARLIGQWAEDSVSQARQPGTVICIARDNVEQLWGVCLSQRSFRRRSDEPGWVRIDLEGIYDVGGTWKANILGQWLDKPMFQVIIPADIHVGRTVIQRAMLQSLNQELTVDVRETPSEPTTLSGVKTRPGITEVVDLRRPGLGGGEEPVNSLVQTLSSVPISSLRHDEL